jgi:hypothetical protein
MIEKIKLLLGKKTLQEIANELGVHKSTIKRKMRKEDIHQPKEYVDKLRLSNSKKGGEAFSNLKKMCGKMSDEDKKNKQKIRNDRKPKGYYNQYVNAYRRRRYWKKKKCIDYKGGKCMICGYSKCIAALEFHHRDPNEKEFKISRNKFDWEKVKDELDKCDLLCSNCHREYHYDQIILDK